MSMDDDAPPGEPGEREWNPDDEKLEREYLRKMIRILDHQMKREEEAGKRDARMEAEHRAGVESVARHAARGIAARVPSPHTGDGASPLVVVRPIENGFIVSFMEIMKSSGTVNTLGLPPEVLESLPPGAKMIGAFAAFKRVEAFVQDAAAVVPYMERAMKSLREMTPEV